jgi:hypothetical protein
VEAVVASEDRQTRDSVLRALVSFGANVTVLTALLVYFGWKRADTQAFYLGIDESILGMTTRDYLLRSVDALVVPIGIAVGVGLAWLFLYEVIDQRLSQGGAWPRLWLVTGVLRYSWIALPLLAFAVGLGVPGVGRFAWPLSFGIGALATAYGVHLGRRLAESPASAHELPAWHAALTKGLLAMVVALSSFWAVANLAAVRGAKLASRPATSMPAVVAYSAQRLSIDAPGIVEERLDGESNAYQFRYRGLRLLDNSGGRFFFLSDCWDEVDGIVIMLDDDASVRFEFIEAPEPPSCSG